MGVDLLVDLTVEVCPVLDCAKQAAHVDVVEAVRLVSPLKLSIVELEFEIWRDETGLDGGNVCADHLC
jgi:hypothetical protein